MDKSALSDEILSWSKNRPSWQRDALRRVFTSGELSPKDVDELLAICKASHGLHAPMHTEPLATEHLRASNGAADPVTLSSITHHQGVNALAADQTVTFGPNLTIVYGQNAAGKSGYTRILKRLCRSRSIEDILGNVLSGDAPAAPRATVKYRRGNDDEAFAWTAGAQIPVDLSLVSVFDSHCAPVYLKDKTDVAFRPFGLDIFDKLSAACGHLRSKLEAERTQLNVTARPIPLFPSGTQVRGLTDSLSALTKPERVRQLATLSPEEQRRLKGLRDQRRDLQASDPKAAARELSLKADRLEGLIRHLQALNDNFANAKLAEIRNCEASVRSANEALALLQATTMTPNLLQGTGGSEWKRMWEASAAFSHAAYPGRDFPAVGTDAVCPFCQQPLTMEAASRLEHFAEYVRSTALQQVSNATEALESALKPLRTVTVKRDDVLLTVNEIAADDPEFGSSVASYLSAVEELQAATTVSTLAADTTLTSIDLAPLRAKAAHLRSRALELLKDVPAMLPETAAELIELEAREALGQSSQLVLDEIERRQRLGAYTQCIEDTATQSITRKSTEMTKQLITDNLRQRFEEELKQLEFRHLAVEIQAAGGTRGTLYHRLVFTNAPNIPVGGVLSEGESRTLSLAAFITELQTATVKSGIIFDDPVSSLDHVWRERISRRLVAEAKGRQVIVFTHDLLFLKYLISECEAQDVSVTHQYLERSGVAGLSSPDLPYIAMNVNQRIAKMRNRWQTVDKVYRVDGPTAFESSAREMYRLLRQAWEQAVSEVLLNDVVQRYRPSIETQKVRYLHDITQSDCDTVEAEMAECSRWLHDEAAADVTPLPGPQALKDRIDTLDLWVHAIRSRRKK